MARVVKQAEVRRLGRTELNWVAAVESGTGITITSMLFEGQVDVGELKRALGDLLALHPRLRSLIVKEDRTFVFRTPEEVYVRLTEGDLSSGVPEGEEDGKAKDPWHVISEMELNSPFSKDYPIPVFQPKLYLLPGPRSLLVLRVHAAAADVASTSTMVKQIVSSLQKRSAVSGDANGGEELLPAVEDAIPPGQANKPFWAHGVDVVGYGLSSRRHAHLPFEDTDSPRTSKLIRAGLTADATSSLLKECEKREVSIHGVTIAAALKAIASFKQVGTRGEHYGATVLVQCRSLLEPPLPESAIGFYHSALLRTIHTTEPEPFWELATRCSRDFDNAVKSRKHFTDMGDLNGLMEQAMRFPALTPSGTMRTSVLSSMFDPVIEDLGEEAAAVGVKDFLSCSSTHGVGPCLALFPFLRNGSLQFSFVYSSPLFSRPLMQNLVDSLLFYLSEDESQE